MKIFFQMKNRKNERKRNLSGIFFFNLERRTNSRPSGQSQILNKNFAGGRIAEQKIEANSCEILEFFFESAAGKGLMHIMQMEYILR